MSALMQWFSMGGYGAYVWPAYGLAAAVFLGNLLLCKRQQISVQKALKQWFKGRHK
ncbi:heme exporter protein CcmD [Legionella yabuuchiae]|uniref:heme exporter protein CcmD n=1 Tax=Legionella yabuuchiae TaxID=376727 RepID=UPI001055271D|nr:heme exporter protein CcmD [Legionella yabuuchiae]